MVRWIGGLMGWLVGWWVGGLVGGLVGLWPCTSPFSLQMALISGMEKLSEAHHTNESCKAINCNMCIWAMCDHMNLIF